MVKRVFQTVVHLKFWQMKCGGASWRKMAGTNRGEDMSYSARSAGSRLLRGERDLTDRGLMARGL